MKTKLLIALIDESIKLELNAATLYEIFSKALPEDRDFWWQFHQEEHSHAALLRNAEDSFVKRGTFPEEILASSIYALRQANIDTERYIRQCESTPPTRRGACEIAIAVEHEAGEQHYMNFMEKTAETPIESVFQQLNCDDKGHEERIRAHLKSLPQEKA